MNSVNPNIDAFNRDVLSNLGYLYTTNARLSSQLANRRISDVALALADFGDRRVLDIGCGDGTYTIELFYRGKCASIHGVDPAQSAIEIAQQKADHGQITFAVCDAYELPYEANSFDIAYIRGVLHHLDRPINALREALRVAPTLVVVEPNGYNPVLKLIEKCSRYHIQHQEKSYAPMTLDKWVKSIGGRVSAGKCVGLVPMFCPDWFAKTIKLIEPVVERLPLINALSCAVYVFVAQRRS